MKRRITALLAVLALCALLCSCRVDVDELRAQHGVWDESGNIVLNGAVYRPFIASDSLNPVVDFESTIYVTEPDIPLLLARSKGDVYSISVDCVFLEYSAHDYYCREDKYDEVQRLLADSPTIDTFRYACYGSGGKVQSVVLNAEQAASLQSMLDTLEWKAGEAYEQPLLDDDYNHLMIWRCSADGWFTEGNPIYVYWVSGKSEYLLETQTMLDYYATCIAYVPTADQAVFKELFKPALDAADKDDWIAW